MKTAVLLVRLLLIFEVSESREIQFESFEYSPKKSDLIGYGSLRLIKNKNKKNTFTLSGNYSVKRELGNEKVLIMDVMTKSGALLSRTVQTFCEFTRSESGIWPDFVKQSSMPKDGPCPFPSVISIFRNFTAF